VTQILQEDIILGTPAQLTAMKFSIKRNTIAGETIELERSALSGAVKVSQAGKVLERLKEARSPFPIEMKDRSKKKLYIKARWLDPVPVVFLEEEEILLAEKLRAIDYIFACFPILMFLVYGALSTIAGFFLLMANFRILRTKMQPTVKWAAIYAMDIASFWIVMAIVKFVWSAGK